MSAQSSDVLVALEPFQHEGWISEIVREIKSGKEATVYCCRGGEGAPGQLLAAKVYRPLESRRFRNDAIYQAGRVHLARDSRVRRAANSKSAFGREVQYATWLDHEWEMLNVLHRASADVPEPLARAERAILMPFIGEESGPAPMLNDVDLPRSDVESILDRLLENVELMLDLHVVHGDLSPFNVLHWNHQAIIIDFPQAIDPRLNPAGDMLLARDVRNLCVWAARYGVQRDAATIASELWSRFVEGEIG